MRNDITELVFILDRSGSMSGLESDTVGGFNAMIARQKRENSAGVVTTVLFDTRADRIHDRMKLEDVPLMTEHDYTPGGCTALLDAIGDTVRHIAHIHRYARPEDVPGRTVVIITTDGMENASRHCSLDEIRRLIRHEQEKYGWEFLFLGADIDAVEVAGSMGIGSARTANFMHDERGVALCFEAVGAAVSSVRSCGAVPPSWNDRVEKDRRKRGR